MKKFGTLSTLVLVSLFFAACEDSQPVAEMETLSETVAPVEPVDTTRFIPSADLFERMQSEIDHYVFDVRSEVSYAESHIENSLNMPYGKTGPDDVAALERMTLDTPIVTYCGCPHTLAGLAADQLIEWGYRNVRVLHEGYWYWRDNRFPVAGAQAQSVTELYLSGVIRDAGQIGAKANVFIRNSRNGQLEAAITDSRGRFETSFHVLDWRPDDRFEIRVGGIDAAVFQQLDLNRNPPEFTVRMN